MMQQIKITNSRDSVTIDIEGTIGVPEQWQFEEPQQRVATYETFRKTIQQIEELNSAEVVVNIRSTGGDVNDALLIYDALRSLNATITTRCFGYVASAATVIAQAASEGLREISSNALYLVHNSQCAVEGSVQDLTQRIDLLKKTDERLAQLYAQRSNGDATTFAELMNEQNGAGRWLNAQETITLGLADRLIEDSTAQVDETQEVREEQSSTVERALSQVRNVVNRIGAHIKAGLSHESSAEEMEPKAESLAIEHTLPQANSAASFQSAASQLALREGQNSLSKSTIQSVEDPTLKEVQQSANHRAYSADAKRLKR